MSEIDVEDRVSTVSSRTSDLKIMLIVIAAHILAAALACVLIARGI